MAITETQAIEINSRLANFNAWLGKRTSYKTEEIPSTVLTVSNEERSALEIYNFINEKPERYFFYINYEQKTATTWSGDKLGDVIHFGYPWRDSFGGTRISVRIRAINGRVYSGTYFSSAGDYARCKAVKA